VQAHIRTLAAIFAIGPMKQKILQEFDERHTLLDRFKKKIETILIELLQEKKILIHQITCRVKDKISLEKKIDKKEGKYKALIEITDIVGLRVITYLESDVDKVAKIIENEFLIDKENSIDKRKLKSDQFGYRSLHYVVSLDKARSQITENKVFNSFKAEIQIRSILQHAWAEIEHDLGYKGQSSIPDEYVRNFNRLAALLETADKEFDRLKHDLSEYERNVRNYISESPQDVELNQASISSFIHSNDITKHALEIIKRNTGAEIISSLEYVGIIERFKGFFGIQNIKELQDIIIQDQIEYLHFVDQFTKDLKYEKLIDSLPIFYLQHYLASKTENVEKVNEYFDFGKNKIDKKDDGVNRFINLYRAAKTASNNGYNSLPGSF